MAEHEQVKPLAPVAFRLRSDDDEALSGELKLHQRKYIKCCGCVIALLLIIAVTILVLMFTVFHIKDPRIKLNKVTIQQGPNFLNLSTSVNMILLADVSMKNPNAASFKFGNATTTFYYGGMEVGDGRVPSGRAKARRTIRMNITVDINPRKLMAAPGIVKNISSGALTMSSYTSIGGKVKILNIIKKHMVVNMNCTFTYNILSQAIHDDICMTHVKV